MLGTLGEWRQPHVGVIPRAVHTIQKITHHTGIFGILWQDVNVCRVGVNLPKKKIIYYKDICLVRLIKLRKFFHTFISKEVWRSLFNKTIPQCKSKFNSK